MSETFELTMLPASEGDSLLLTYGEQGGLHHVVVDLGRTRDYKSNKSRLADLGHVELFVVSHIDADHIEGAMPLVREAAAPFEPDDVWFNAYHHLVEARDATPQDFETFSATQGEKLSHGIKRFEWPWNKCTGGGPISLEKVPKPISLPSGLKITLLSPDNAKLRDLESNWLVEIKKASLRPFDPDKLEREANDGFERFGGIDVEELAAAPFSPDKAKPNGSSIAFLAEYLGKRVMLLADAHPDIVDRQVEALASREPGGRVRLDLLKVSHHGSAANTSPRLLDLIDCSKFAFSTDGTRHGHPHGETVARILVSDPERKKVLFFNFHQDNTDAWDLVSLRKRWNYSTVFPDAGENGRLRIRI